jgi:HEPN domain-containing protein
MIPFFRRRQEEREELPKVFRQDIFPKNVKTQIWMIWQNAFEYRYQREKAEQTICLYLRKEIGVETIGAGLISGDMYGFNAWSYGMELKNFLFSSLHAEGQMGVDFSLTVVQCMLIYIKDEEKITDINKRFKIAGMGYRVIERKLIPFSNEHMIVEVVEPAIKLLHQKYFDAANKEFLQAFDSYKTGDYKESINAAIRAVESVLKSIADRTKKFSYSKTDTLTPLLKSFIGAGFLPAYFTNFANSLENVLKNAGEIRNAESGHGKADKASKDLEEHYVEYVLNQTASTILFIVQSSKLKG